MLPSGVNKIIQEYCYYKPDYLFNLEWWKPESMRTELLEYLSNRNTTFMRCDNHCKESLKYCDLNTALCEECMDGLYMTYIYFRINKVCSLCRIKRDLCKCGYCFREFCFPCYYKIDPGNELFERKPNCLDCSEKIKNKEEFLITEFPLTYPDYGFYYHKTGNDFNDQ